MNWGNLANALCVEELNWAIYLRKLADRVKDSNLEQLLLVHAIEEEKHGKMLQAIARVENCNPRIAKTSNAVANWKTYSSDKKQYKPFKIEGGRSRRIALKVLLGNKKLEDYDLDRQIAFVVLVEFLGLIFYSILSEVAPLPLKGVAKKISQDEADHVFFYLYKKEALFPLVFWLNRLLIALPVALIEIGSLLQK